ncbi:hypothetical protein JW711_06140 [Candidatus Woesearchaeota archaeon]|nr:hypothetical protein [Candidatus Woesearchaeota archaeon]
MGGRQDDFSFKKEANGLFRLLPGALLLSGALAISPPTIVSLTDVYYQKTSSQRQAFKKKFGFPITGLSSEVEGRAYKMTELADVMMKENREKEFIISKIELEPDNYLFKSPLGVYHMILVGNTRGYKIPEESPLFSDVIGLTIDPPLAFKEAAHHEIKHDKLEMILAKQPELDFKRRWEAILFEDGKPYMTMEEKEAFSSKTRGGFRRDAVAISGDDTMLKRLIEYSQYSFIENVACFTGIAETAYFNPGTVRRAMELEPKLARLYALAEEAHMIPRGTLAFLELSKLEDDIGKKGTAQDRLLFPERKYLVESLKFLQNDRNTPFEGRIRFHRGVCLRNYGYVTRDMKWFYYAECEFKQGLRTTHKDIDSYRATLHELGRMYDQTGVAEHAAKIFKAEEEFERRYEQGDIQLPERGVNDILRQSNIL